MQCKNLTSKIHKKLGLTINFKSRDAQHQFYQTQMTEIYAAIFKLTVSVKKEEYERLKTPHDDRISRLDIA